VVNPTDDRPLRPHAACLGYGCHECEYSGEVPGAQQDLKDEAADAALDTNKEMKRGL
jgi:hypothetical protein